jgi:CRP-like cAMP-binding protein
MRKSGALGKVYLDGEVIVRQGEVGDSMYVIQEGQVEVVAEQDGNELRLNVLEAGQFFGEMAIVEREARVATVRALGAARVLLSRVHKDPSLAFRIMETMSQRIRELDAEVTRLRGSE